MGTSRNYGQVVIRRSDDGGRTWTTPEDGRTGLLLSDPGYHTSTVPVVVHRGRIWRAMEDNKSGGRWPRHFRAFVMSCPVDADLLNAENWTVSNSLAFDPEWIKSAPEGPGWLEGNIVITPQNKLINILRVNSEPGDIAAICRVSADGKTISFDPKKDFVDFPGGRAKFTIRFDPESGRYWSLTNKQENPTAYRNILTLISSSDLRKWQVDSTVLQHGDKEKHAWQYIDWQFEDRDIIFVSRTSWDGHTAHDANYFTFHRIKDFRAQKDN
jgi:hypothetical protein